MNKINEDFTAEDILPALYKLASVGASKAINMDLMKLEKLSSEKMTLSELSVLALAGAETADQKAFANACLSASKTLAKGG